ncbi:MAG: hypothetical protein ACREAA_07105 [Candidatus Polarisedimenticolia bacterium]
MTHTILDYLRDRNLFGGLRSFQSLATWQAWIVFLKAVYGLPMQAAEVALFCLCTGRSAYNPPRGGWPEVVCIVARRAGKTKVCGTIAAFEAATAPPHPDGDELYALCIGQDYRGAMRALLAHASAPFHRVPMFRRMVTGQTADTITLENGVRLAAYPCKPSAARGLGARIVLMDEPGHYGAGVDVEMLRAVRPTVSTTGGKIVLLSSPRGQAGLLYDLHKKYFGTDDPSILVWQAPAKLMNPTLDDAVLDRMRRDDPEGAEAEVEGRFMAGLSNLFEVEAVEACVVSGRRELAPLSGVRYAAFCDPAGGSGTDSYTLAVAHRDRERVIVDAVREWRPKFNPSSVTAEAATVLKSYGVQRVTGDRFGGEFPRELFRSHGIQYEVAEEDRSGLYLAMLPAVNAGLVELLDIPALATQLRMLERRRAPSGKDRVDHPRCAHDDVANAVAGAVYLLRGKVESGALAFMRLRRAQREAEQAEAKAAGISIEELWSRKARERAKERPAPHGAVTG